MNLKPLATTDLETFFAVKPRGLPSVLRDLRIRPIGGMVQVPVIWTAIGLAGDQAPEHWAELCQALMRARDVATYCGVSASIIYRWNKGKRGAGVPPMPPVVDLSNGREEVHRMRWRRSEIVAWQNRNPQPIYARPAPLFGTLKPSR